VNHDIVDELFRKYYNEALLYTISICRNRTMAEDIVADAFFKALTANNDDIRNFKPWLLTVCRNEFLSICRKNAKMSDEELSEELEDDSGDISDGLIRNEEYRTLYQAVNRLNPVQKEAITLFYFNNLQILQIAAIMGKSEANVKVLLFRGREQLKRIMEGQTNG